jgi:peptidyl-prolyl cis-trans isomerase B (cyclophilin B)
LFHFASIAARLAVIAMLLSLLTTPTHTWAQSGNASPTPSTAQPTVPPAPVPPAAPAATTPPTPASLDRSGFALRADRLYCTVGRPIPVTVEARATAGRLEVALLEFDGTERSRVAVLPGQIDLSPLFPELWEQAPRRVLRAQLLVAGEPAGASIILQPMLAPRVATLDARGGGAVIFTKPKKVEDVYSGLRVYVDTRIELVTDEGTMRIALRPDAAPNTAFHIRQLASGGFYTDMPFHRIVPAGRDGHPFVVQVGDPTGSGEGGPGFMIDLEPSTLQHDLGVVSMARTPEPNTNGSQFFIALSRAGTARLDGAYCAFGTLVDEAGVESLATLRAIAKAPLEPGTQRPVRPPTIRQARLVDAPPTTPMTRKATTPQPDAPATPR